MFQRNTSIFNLIFALFLPIGMAAQCEQLVWADEFGGTTLDLTKWTPIVGPGGAVSGNAELQYYLSRPENIQVNNGTLKIIALNDGYGGNSYTSGRMQSKNLGDFLYGRFEARMKLPAGYGMWPAFWMLPTDNSYGIWPRSGEIDIMELIGRQPATTYATIHTSSDATDHDFGNSYTLPTGNFNNAFHVFSVEWSPNLLKFYMDGILYSTQTNTSITPQPWVFNKRFYMLLNLAIGGPWAYAPNSTTIFPQTMEIDYVRVYQKIGDIAIKGKKLVEPTASSIVYSVPNITGVSYNWSVSGTGNTIASGQGTSQIAVNWGNNNGVVSLALNDGCTPVATVSLPVTVTPNLWENPGFEQNYMAWDTRPAYSSTATFNICTSDVTEGAKKACIQTNTASPSTPWDIQLSRTNLSLIGGTTYSLHFKAKSNAVRTIPISFIRPVVFTTVASSTAALTTEWKDFQMTFTPANNEIVMFNADLAGQVGMYHFDDFTFARAAMLPVESLDNNEGLEKSTLTIYPNPAKDILIIENANGRDILLVNALGIPLQTFYHVENFEKLNIATLPNGVYFIKTAGVTKRFVKN